MSVRWFFLVAVDRSYQIGLKHNRPKKPAGVSAVKPVGGAAAAAKPKPKLADDLDDIFSDPLEKKKPAAPTKPAAAKDIFDDEQ